MISITRKQLPYQPLAYTDVGEHAYFLDAASMQDLGVYNADSVSASTPSGFPLFPDILSNGRLTMFIAGNPGAGKSYLAKELISRLPEDLDVLLFTALEENDGNFSDIKRLYKIKMEPENLKNITLSAIRARSKHPLLLFDDVDKIRRKDVQKLVFAIMEDALANGRGHKHHDGEGDVHVIITSHCLNDYVKTKYSLENSDYVALFPASTTYSQMKRMFDKLGLSKEECEFIMKLGKRGDFRSIIIRKVAPMYILYGNTITLI
ncbi:MAG: AAA family ATPase [Methanobrevibacter sp.]|nr:AAA family ATPase [Methanobrevibacter sp.]